MAAGRGILLAGDDSGAGSSREHAPWALRAGASGRSCRPRTPTSSAATAQERRVPIVVDRPPTGGCRVVEADPEPSCASTSPSRGCCRTARRSTSTSTHSASDPARGHDEIGYVLVKAARHRRLGGRPPGARRHPARDAARGLARLLHPWGRDGDFRRRPRYCRGEPVRCARAARCSCWRDLAEVRAAALPQVGGIGGGQIRHP